MQHQPPTLHALISPLLRGCKHTYMTIKECIEMVLKEKAKPNPDHELIEFYDNLISKETLKAISKGLNKA